MNSLSHYITSDRLLSDSIDVLEESLTAFSEVTRIPVTFFSPEDVECWCVGEAYRICSTNDTYPDPESKCRKTLRSAMNIARGLGEVYIFSCAAGMINLAYAFHDGTRMLGYFIAGPIAMGVDIGNVERHFFDRIETETINLPRLLPILTSQRMYTPKETSRLMILFENAVTSPFRSIAMRPLGNMDAALSKTVEVRQSSYRLEYPLAAENDVLRCLRAGNAAASNAAFSKYVEDLMVFDGGNLFFLKIRLLVFFSQNLKAADLTTTRRSALSYLEAMNGAETLKELVKGAHLFIEDIAESISRQVYSGDSHIVSEAVQYIRMHYNKALPLAEIAGAVHANKSYLSTVFKKETGMSITDYILDLRLADAKEKLKDTGFRRLE